MQKNDGLWQYHQGATHLTSDSIMTEANHTHWRQKAIQEIQFDNDFSLHYTSVFSLSRADTTLLREFLLKSIAEARKISDPSECEQAFCLNLDFFEV